MAKLVMRQMDLLRWGWMLFYEERGHDPTEEELVEQVDRCSPVGRSEVEKIVRKLYRTVWAEKEKLPISRTKILAESAPDAPNLPRTA